MRPGGSAIIQKAAGLRSRTVEGSRPVRLPRAVARQLGRVASVAGVFVLCCMMPACRVSQNESAPVIEFTQVPRAGEGGPDRMDMIAGRVIRGRPGQRIVLFAHWGPWWVQPLVDHPFTAILPDSTWRNSTHLGTQYAAVLVDGNYQPPASVESLPTASHGVVAIAVVNGRPVFWQRSWFLLAATLVSGIIVGAYFRFRMVRMANEDRRFREAIEAMPAMAYITRPDGNCTFVNRGWIEFTGLTTEQSAGSGWHAAVHPQDLSQLVNKWQAALASGEPLEHETRICRAADGAFRWFLMRAAPLKDSHGKILNWCGAATDIEDRKRAEQLQADLTHVNRVSTMGELVASISHELLQPITATTLNAKASLRWLQRDPPDLTKVRQGTEKIIESGIFAAEIIDRLRSLYKKAPPKRELVAINEVVCEIASMLKNEARSHEVLICTELKKDLPAISADRVQLQQVLMNLMLNGIEAMRDTGGVLTVKSQSDVQGVIQISVSDTGHGLPPDKADKLFESFFTTKAEGSGMGLPISKSIVEAHGGRIWASGNGGQGATFHFTLPACTGYSK
jgi:PAS domain S-box-containing protein